MKMEKLLQNKKNERKSVMKKENIMIRVAADEKEEIKAAAEKQQMTMSEYLLALHRDHINKKHIKGAH